MTDRRSLSTDLTGQGKWQAEHGATPDPIVVLSDGQTWTCAEGCRLVVPTMEHAAELHNHGMKVNDVQAVAEYNVDALPQLVRTLSQIRRYWWHNHMVKHSSIDGKFDLNKEIDAALDAAIEREDGAK